MPTHSNTSFNYKLTKFFIERSRLTILALLLLIVAGIGSITFNTLSGFPAIEIKLAIIQTQYPGASSQTVADDVTAVIENEIQGVEGVKTFSSTSQDSFSSINITLTEDSDTEAVRSRLTAKLDEVDLPEDASSPRLFIPSTGGDSFIYAISATSREELFKTTQTLETEIRAISNVSDINFVSELKEELVLTYDAEALRQNNIRQDQIESLLESSGQTIPLSQNLQIDGSDTIALFTLPEVDTDSILETLIPGAVAPNGETVTIGDVASVETQYLYTTDNDQLSENSQTIYSYNSENGARAREAVILSIDATENADVSIIGTEIQDVVEDQGLTFYTAENIEEAGDDEIVVSEVFSEGKDNQRQVDQVLQGLVGGKIGDSPIGYIGLALGAIQLVFLVMLCFVSWRSAIIATIAIPLSIFFATITLFLQGESINFLVLFSTVLVIGLVVDPTLVILEAIQRKMDTGLKGKEAVLEAVKDVGDGLFSSTLTNIIVFVPFGIISGFLGQIFGFIPATIIPAIIGSYFVALVFLSWLGSLFLKPTKNKSTNEEENLWGIARWFIRTNTRILKGPRWIRLGIIVIALVLSFGITGYMFNSESVRSVQFSSEQNTNLVLVNYEFLEGVTEEQQLQINEEISEKLVEFDAVVDSSPFSRGRQSATYVNLKPVGERGDQNDITTLEFADELTEKFNNEYVIDNNEDGLLFDFLAAAITSGPPEASYQISLVVNSNDLDLLKTGSLDLRETALNICKDGAEYSIDTNCEAEQIVTKVDDGFTNRESQVVQISLRDEDVIAQGFAGSQEYVGPIFGQLRSNFSEPLSETADVNGVAIVSFTELDNPSTLEEIESISLFNNFGQQVQLSAIADVTLESPKQSIRRIDGNTVNQINIRLNQEYAGNQAVAGLVSQTVLDYYKDNDGENAKALGLEAEDFDVFAEGDTESANRSFAELGISLLLAIFLIYAVLVVFFDSFTMPLVILFTIPLTFVGVFPGLAFIANGEFGFLETIGIIILAGLVVNVAIYLIDAAKQKIAEGADPKDAIAYASGVRFRAVLLTNMTAIASLAPLAYFSEFYRSIAVTIIAGLTTSALTSLFTTPILFTFFQWLTKHFHEGGAVKKILMFVFFPIMVIYLGIVDRPKKKKKAKKKKVKELEESSKEEKKSSKKSKKK